MGVILASSRLFRLSFGTSEHNLPGIHFLGSVSVLNIANIDPLIEKHTSFLKRKLQRGHHDRGHHALIAIMNAPHDLRGYPHDISSFGVTQRGVSLLARPLSGLSVEYRLLLPQSL